MLAALPEVLLTVLPPAGWLGTTIGPLLLPLLVPMLLAGALLPVVVAALLVLLLLLPAAVLPGAALVPLTALLVVVVLTASLPPAAAGASSVVINMLRDVLTAHCVLTTAMPLAPSPPVLMLTDEGWEEDEGAGLEALEGAGLGEGDEAMLLAGTTTGL